jgi:hypothetical protein
MSRSSLKNDWRRMFYTLLAVMVIRDMAGHPNLAASLDRTVLCAAPMIGIDTFDLVA